MKLITYYCDNPAQRLLIEDFILPQFPDSISYGFFGTNGGAVWDNKNTRGIEFKELKEMYPNHELIYISYIPWFINIKHYRPFRFIEELKNLYPNFIFVNLNHHAHWGRAEKMIEKLDIRIVPFGINLSDYVEEKRELKDWDTDYKTLTFSHHTDIDTIKLFFEDSLWIIINDLAIQDIYMASEVKEYLISKNIYNADTLLQLTRHEWLNNFQFHRILK
jgi:hypothetical protein